MSVLRLPTGAVCLAAAILLAGCASQMSVAPAPETAAARASAHEAPSHKPSFKATPDAPPGA